MYDSLNRLYIYIHIHNRLYIHTHTHTHTLTHTHTHTHTQTHTHTHTHTHTNTHIGHVTRLSENGGCYVLFPGKLEQFFSTGGVPNVFLMCS
jgi:hypothetical protein